MWSAYNSYYKAIRSIVSLHELFADRDDIGLCVSPNGKWRLYSQLDRSGSNVMLAEGPGKTFSWLHIFTCPSPISLCTPPKAGKHILYESPV